MKNPMIHLIIGDGRGKTTSAYGLALRALGQGLRVAVMNFLKSDSGGEGQGLQKMAEAHPLLSIYSFEKKRGFYYQLKKEEKEALAQEVEQSFLWMTHLILEGTWDVLILDEVLDAVNLSLLDCSRLIQLLEKNKNTEIVMTGRDPHPELYQVADYISEIKKIKHPYDKGILARKGIEY